MREPDLEFRSLFRPYIYAWFRRRHCLYVGSSRDGFGRLRPQHPQLREFDSEWDTLRIWFVEGDLDEAEQAAITELKPQRNRRAVGAGRRRRQVRNL